MAWEDDDDWAELDTSEEAREQRKRDYLAGRAQRDMVLRIAYGILALLIIAVIVLWQLS